MSDSIRVLILEDRHDDAEIMAIELESDGFDVVWERVETARDFVTRLSDDIDVILADYTLPQFSAPDALNLLKQHGSDIPVIVVTGSISEETAVSCMRQGAADYLLKDRLSRLGEAVRHAIDQRQMRQIQRRAELELTLLGYAVENSINAVVMTELNGVITFINRAVRTLWCVEADQPIVGETLSHLLNAPGDAEHLLESLNREITSKGELNSYAWNGKPMILQYAANQVIDPSGQILSLMFTFIDVTEQKKAESLRSELERERELRELRSRFVSMLVHDFRNPLTSLQVSLSLLDKYHERLTPEQIQDKVKSALLQSSHINRLIDDVLLVGKLENTAKMDNMEELDLVGYCKRIVEEFQPAIDPEIHTLTFEAMIPHLSYLFDPVLMQRVLMNLLSNAHKYSPNGGDIRFTVDVDDRSVMIKVADQGIGIPGADVKRVFEGFHRAGNVGKIPGTGLGLATVRQIVEIHRGTIECESQINRGTVFCIRLPLKL